MTNDTVTDALQHLDRGVSDQPPRVLLVAARESAAGIKTRRQSVVRNRFLVVIAALTALLAASLTPPGRAATEWVVDLAGVGDPPSLDFPFDEPGAVVIATGSLSDGSPYEVVARVLDPSARGPMSQPQPRGLDLGSKPAPADGGHSEVLSGPNLCIGIDLPTVPGADQDSACVDTHFKPNGHLPFTSYGSGVASNDPRRFLFFGLVEDSRVAEIQVVANGGAQSQSLVPGSLLTVDEDLLAQVGRPDPLRVYVSPIAAELVHGVRAGELELHAIGRDAHGSELGRAQVIPSQ